MEVNPRNFLYSSPPSSCRLPPSSFTRTVQNALSTHLQGEVAWAVQAASPRVTQKLGTLTQRTWLGGIKPQTQITPGALDITGEQL